MTIPTRVMLKMATIGLTESQAEAVAWMLSEVERATQVAIVAHLEPSRESARLRVSRYHDRLGLSTREWRDLRNEVFARDGRKCVYCGSTEAPLHIDHVVPLIQGGGNEIANLVVACRACNCGKSGRTPEQWTAQ